MSSQIKMSTICGLLLLIYYLKYDCLAEPPPLQYQIQLHLYSAFLAVLAIVYYKLINDRSFL